MNNMDFANHCNLKADNSTLTFSGINDLHCEYWSTINRSTSLRHKAMSSRTRKPPLYLCDVVSSAAFINRILWMNGSFRQSWYVWAPKQHWLSVLLLLPDQRTRVWDLELLLCNKASSRKKTRSIKIVVDLLSKSFTNPDGNRPEDLGFGA